MAIRIAGVDVINDDRELVLAKLTEINSSIDDTAVDVFVYDTSKDSDGGAWRHRTQHTSWYAEASSASRDEDTRSTRAEFPAVAVIVAETNKVTIYDGDDPSLPMWMVFNQGSFNSIHGNSGIVSVQMLNSVLSVGIYDSGAGGVSVIEFLNDQSQYVYSTAIYSYAQVIGLVNRNAETGSGDLSYISWITQGIVSRAVNDVAMTVLPGAPADPATGLPVPTIAVATEGGVSVIKDDGTVVDITYSSYGIATFVTFSEEDELMFLLGASSTTPLYLHIYHAIPSADVANSHGYLAGASDEFYSVETGFTNVYTGLDGIIPFINETGSAGDLEEITDRAIGNAKGLVAVDRVPSAPTSTSFAAITSTFNTGWMPGDIKLAALADTTAETFGDAVSGATVSDPNLDGVFDGEHVTNGGFTTDTDWTKGTGWTISGGTASIDGTQASTSDLKQSLSGLVAGRTYVVEFEITALSAGRITYIVLGGTVDNTDHTSVGTYSVTMVAGSANNTFIIGARADMVGSIDNISVRLADPDRSVNGNGLAVYGSITKTPVATGADLVAYSGFSSDNYLEQPYNDDLDFGTGDFCVMGWVTYNSGNSNNFIIDRCDSVASTLDRWNFGLDASGLFQRCDSSFISISHTFSDGVRYFICGVRTGGVFYAYVDGVLVGSATQEGDQTDASQSYPLTVASFGGANKGNAPTDIALLRISATAPTADQIRKIYEDERPLFQEDAKATLTGSSDAVTALAHDPDTNLLHVGTPGTSGGRSVFQGLRRVEEHTGTNSQSLTAISAVDGLVVEGK